MTKVSEIQLVDNDGTVRGSITDKFAVSTLVKYSDLIKLLRNARAFEKPVKKTNTGVLKIPVSKSAISDSTLDDMVAFLNGEDIYEYNNAQEALFMNKIYKYNNNVNKNFRESIYQGLQYFLLPTKIINKLLRRGTVYPNIGAYEDEIEAEMNKRREYNRYDPPEYRHSMSRVYPNETIYLTNVEFEAWLRNGGLEELKRHREAVRRNQNNNNNNYENNEYNKFIWNEEEELARAAEEKFYGRRPPHIYGPYGGGKTRTKKYKQKIHKTRKQTLRKRK